MNKIKIIWVLSVLLLLVGNGFSSDLNFHGNASNSVYSYEDTTTHTRLFQNLRFSLESPDFYNMSLNASFRALTDLNESIENNDDRFKAYNLNLKFKKIFNRLDMVLGRQFLHPGTVLGGLDGLYARFYLSKRMSFSAYAGVEANFKHSLEIYKADDSFTTGGLFELKRIYSSRFQLFYLRKANKDDVFWQLTGLNIENSLLPRTNLRIQAHYDLENERLHRLLVSARHRITKKLSFSMGLKNQYPQVYANSFFTIFKIDAYSQYRVSCSYNFFNDYFLSGQYRFIQFDTEDANQLFVTINNANGSIGLIYETGYAGEQIGVMADYAYSITPALIASVSMDYSKYKAEQVYEFDKQIANAARVSYSFLGHWSVDLEYQWLNNKRFKENDSRILNHIRYRW